jgi:hypothetical protein
MMTWREQLETDGFALLHGAFKLPDAYRWHDFEPLA